MSSEKTPYLFANAWLNAYERLRVIERMEDPGTWECLESLGVAKGWYCLEVGGGAGSIANRLCHRVGPTGRVVATDIDTRFLEVLDVPQLEVRTHNIVTDDLEEAAFDLVHTRNLLIHLPERETILGKLAQAVKPGGWLLIEETDFSTAGPDPLAPAAWQALYTKCQQALQRLCIAAGIDRFFGARVFGLLHVLGWEAVHAVGRTQMIQGGSPESAL